MANSGRMRCGMSLEFMGNSVRKMTANYATNDRAADRQDCCNPGQKRFILATGWNFRESRSWQAVQHPR
jgi:hypothetical protein